MTLSTLWRPELDSFGEVRRLHDQIDRLFGQSPFGRAGPGRGASGAFPPVNLWAGPDTIAVTAELPGVDRDAVEISVKDDVLTISGERSVGTDSEEISWHRRERAHGRFRRLVQLPFRVDPDRVDARFEHGVLAIDMHRPEEDQPRRIQINS